MYQLLFRSRWFAAIWVVATLISIGTYVSKGGGSEKIDKAVSSIQARREAQQAPEPAHIINMDANEAAGNDAAADDSPASDPGSGDGAPEPASDPSE